MVGIFNGPAGTQVYPYNHNDYNIDCYDCVNILMVEASRGLENKI